MIYVVRSLVRRISLACITFTLITSSVVVAQSSGESTQTQKPTILITGANRGIGLALSEKFSTTGYNVIATARKPDKAIKLKNLGVQLEALDISSQESVDALAAKLADQSIDILLNNAGMGGHSTRNFTDLDINKLSRVLNVNSLGALRVTQGLLANLMQGNRRVVASISSRMGSIEGNSRGCCYGYRASKTALNSFNKSLAAEFKPDGFTFTVLHPGWVKTAMTSGAATYTTEQSAEHLYKVIDGLSTADNGKFYDLFGKEIPW
ncbi:MAG: NAD(P)-dependent dehydrogenase (short-subunit alcohol dehydrogenase family) [Pseudohongiellaceae bacterium]|jgi:NAD(P)-dependent dehydrogenase (short-subunit alcohol dehydrogenase family)